MKKTGVQNSEEKRIKDIIKPIFDKVLQETNSNSMTTIKPTFKILWRPNNYRLRIKVKEKSNSTLKKIQTTIPKANINKHTKLVSIKNYEGVTLQYGKETLTAIFSQNIINGVKETYLIEAYSIKDLEERLFQKRDEVKELMGRALDIFSKKLNIKLRFEKPQWDRYEDWTKGEDFIDKIPREVIIHDTYFKKVYGEGIEFKQTPKKEPPVVHLKNYIVNRAIEDIAPEIANSINNVGNNLNNSIEKKLAPVIDNLALNMDTHISVLKGIEKAFNKFNDKLDTMPNIPKKPTKRRKYGMSDEDIEKIKNMRL